MSKKSVTFTLESEELKHAFNLYAQSRGVKNVNALGKLALFEYIRRRPPKKGSGLKQILQNEYGQENIK